MRWNRGDALTLAQIPYLDSVVVSSRDQVSTCWEELNGDQLLAHVVCEAVDVLACSQVPELANSVQITASQE